MFGFLLIITAAITTLVVFQAARKLEAANIGYFFNHRQQTLVIYPWREEHNQIVDIVDPVFKVSTRTLIPNMSASAAISTII